MTALRHGSAAFAALLALMPARALAASAVEVVAQEAAQGIAQTPAASIVVAAPLVSDQTAPRGDDLALRIAALVAGKLGAGSHAHPQAVTLGAAHALAGRASALVFVQTEISKGDLRTTVDVYPSMANAWDRIRNPTPAPTGHAFSTAKIDAEVRSFLSSLVLEQASIHKARHDEGEVLAAGCGDVDGDGGDEIVLVSRSRVALGRVKGGRFVAERTAPWSALALRAPIPLREPLASVVIAGSAVDVGFTDRASVALTSDFVGHSPLSGVPTWSGDGVVCLAPDPASGGFEGSPADCAAASAPKPKGAGVGPRFDAFSAATVVDAVGRARNVVATRDAGGRIKLKSGDAQATPDGTYGAQMVVGDVDQDGVPDVVTSVEGPDDAVNVFSWPSGSAELRGRLHLSAPAGVRALAICPPEERGLPVLLAVVGNEVWLVRPGVRGGAGSRGEGPTTSVGR